MSGSATPKGLTDHWTSPRLPSFTVAASRGMLPPSATICCPSRESRNRRNSAAGPPNGLRGGVVHIDVEEPAQRVLMAADILGCGDTDAPIGPGQRNHPHSLAVEEDAGKSDRSWSCGDTLHNRGPAALNPQRQSQFASIERLPPKDLTGAIFGTVSVQSDRAVGPLPCQSGLAPRLNRTPAPALRPGKYPIQLSKRQAWARDSSSRRRLPGHRRPP